MHRSGASAHRPKSGAHRSASARHVTPTTPSRRRTRGPNATRQNNVPSPRARGGPSCASARRGPTNLQTCARPRRPAARPARSTRRGGCSRPGPSSRKKPSGGAPGRCGLPRRRLHNDGGRRSRATAIPNRNRGRARGARRSRGARPSRGGAGRRRGARRRRSGARRATRRWAGRPSGRARRRRPNHSHCASGARPRRPRRRRRRAAAGPRRRPSWSQRGRGLI